MVVLAVGGLAAALVSQHVYGMQPCPWCVLQRVVVLALAIIAAVGWASRSAVGRRIAAAFGLVFALGGIAAALWQHFRAAASASCNLTLADRIVSGLRLDTALPSVFEPRASCADAAVQLFGLPYVIWSLALFVVIGATAAWLLARAPGHGRR